MGFAKAGERLWGCDGFFRSVERGGRKKETGNGRNSGGKCTQQRANTGKRGGQDLTHEGFRRKKMSGKIKVTRTS